MIMSKEGKYIINSDYASQNQDKYGYISIASDYTCIDSFQPAKMNKT